MLFRRDFRALLWGAAFSVAGAGIAISMMALRGDGFGAFFRGIFETYLQPGSHPEVAGVEEIGWLIVSPGAFLSHWMGGSSLVSALVAVILIGLSGFLLLTTKYRGDRLDSPAVLLVLLTVILSVFHAAYDLLLLAGPVVAMVFGLGYWEKSDLGWRVVLTVLLVVPMFNYLSTNIGKGMLDPPEGLWSLICVSNAVLLTAAYVILAVKMIRSRRENGGPITGTDA